MKLDAAKVRACARKLGVGTPQQLEALYRRRIQVPETMNVGVVRKAWNGQCVDKGPARKLAYCLGLGDFLPLLQTDPLIGPWGRLIADESLRDEILEFLPEGDGDLRLVRMPGEPCEGGLPRYPLDTPWSLVCSGRRGQEVLLLLRSSHRFVQLAPAQGEQLANRFVGASLRIPAFGHLEFESADGTGWRQFIVVRAGRIPMPLRGPLTGYDLTLDELDQFALRLPTTTEGSPDIAVDTFEFILCP